MAAGGYLAVLAASAASPVGYTLIKVAHVRKKRGRSSAYLLNLGRFIVVAVFPMLVGLAYLYGKRNLVPISHASAVVWHTALSWVFLPEGKRYGLRSLLGVLFFTAGVSLVIAISPTGEEDEGDWGRLAAWVVAWQAVGLASLAVTSRSVVFWFALFAMLKSTEIMASAAAWNLVRNDYKEGWGLCGMFAPSLLFSGFAGVILTDNLINMLDMCRVMPVNTALYCVTGVVGDMVFYARWTHLGATEMIGLWGGVIIVVCGIVLFRV
jgi:hypothetical protein